MGRVEGSIFTDDSSIDRLIRYFKHTELERDKWDRCIAGAVFESLYPYSWYLDLVSPGWGGLVKGDYESVMPLTGFRKYGFHMLLQPILAQQLGVFSKAIPGEKELREFVGALPSCFRYVDICMNIQNSQLPDGISHRERVNYELDLKSPANYNSNTKRNIRKGGIHPFEFREISVDQYLDLKYSTGDRIMVKRPYLERLFMGLEKLNRAGAFGLFLEGRLHAAAVLGFAETRVIYMNGSSSKEGKDTRAMFVLMDHLIQWSRDKFPVFDFEGSNLPGVARFFEGFGADKTRYYRIVRAKFTFVKWMR